jgi:DNA-binding FadR family transcriptional regulator
MGERRGAVKNSFVQINWYDEYMKDKYQVPPLSIPSATEVPIARRKLAHEVLDRLLPRIRAGEFPVGSLMPSERELMANLGVGRPAIREAMQALQRMGLVDIVHGEGAKVLPMTADSVIAQISDAAMHLLSGSSDLLEHLKAARLEFEVAMIRTAAQRASPEQIAHLRELLDQHKDSLRDPQRFLSTDMAFHRGIAEISGNLIYKAVSQAILGWMAQFHQEAVRAPGAEKTTFNEHVQMFDCIAQHDPQGAAAAMVAHLRRAHRHYALQAAPRKKASSTRKSS